MSSPRPKTLSDRLSSIYPWLMLALMFIIVWAVGSWSGGVPRF